MVDTAQEARDLVAAMRYPRRGIRGVGSIVARASHWGRIEDYVDAVEEELCLLVQIESERGLENLDEIAKVDGVDGVFIGPADLSASMGHLGDPGHPEVSAAIEKAIRHIRKLGKAAGIMGTEPAAAKHHISCGASFVAIAVDTMLFTRAMDDAWQRTIDELARH